MQIMSGNNLPEPPLKLGSLNEVERKLEVQRLNFENSLLLDRYARFAYAVISLDSHFLIL
jgi:hypothetical protein